MLPNKLQHGEKLDDLFRKYNEMVDYLRETRLVPGPGMRINRLPSGITIESTAKPGGGLPSAPPKGHPFDLQIINDGTEESPVWKVKILDSLFNDGRAGIIFIGTTVVYPLEQILSIPSGPSSSYVYLRVQYVNDPQSYSPYVTDFVIFTGSNPYSDDLFYLREIGMITWQNGVPNAVARLDQDIEIIERWI